MTRKPKSIFSACTGLPGVVRSTSFKCPGGPEKSNSEWCATFPASNIFSLGNDTYDNIGAWTPGKANYWLAEQGKSGKDQGFTLYLGCNKTVVGIMLKNTRDAEDNDGGTKRFRILGSFYEDGPWHELLKESLEDSRQQEPPPVQQFMIANPVVVSFVKFELLEYWGYIGGLQYFAVNSSTGQRLL